MTGGRSIDLNSDLGESFGAYQIGADEEIFELISSANVACGFHGGDPRVMERTISAAKAHGVEVGAHPGFLDLVGFGRRAIAATPDEIRTDVLYQVGALDAFCRVAGVTLQHVKPHGALYNLAATRPEIAGSIAWAIRAYNPQLLLLAQPGTALAAAGEATGLPIAREGFADRAYNADGTLVSRQTTGALITDPSEAADRMLRLVTEGKLRTLNGKDLTLTVDSICVHSDTPGAVDIMRAVRQRLEGAGVTIRPLRVSGSR
jgi:UPF0271 protein